MRSATASLRLGGVSAQVGTAGYLSPEMVARQGHGLPLDYYCLGCWEPQVRVEVIGFQDAGRVIVQRTLGRGIHSLISNSLVSWNLQPTPAAQRL